jgi:uncharacterized membrane protein (UPF0127 family)
MMYSGIVCLGDNILETLLAISGQEQEQGLMYVEPPVPVMSFVYAKPMVNRFWMKNCLAALDIVFCHQSLVSQICYGEPYSTRIIGGEQFSDLIVELPFGTVDDLGIKMGQSAKIMTPSFAELRKILATA